MIPRGGGCCRLSGWGEVCCCGERMGCFGGGQAGFMTDGRRYRGRNVPGIGDFR
jgi:hypothetical protein